MSALFKCPPCEAGDHANHVEAWNPAPKGVLGGTHCPCKGGCKEPNLEAIFGKRGEPK